MALNRKKAPVQIPAPSASSTEAEDSSSSGEEEQQQEPQPALKPQQLQQEDVDDEDDDEEEEEEEESDEPEKAAAQVTPASKKPQSESESEEEEEDDEESDSEDDGKAIKLSSVSDFTVKPSVNKSPEPATVLTKRAPENAGSSKNNKKAKVSDGDGKIAGSAVDDSKKSPVSRVWSENDEILVLEGFHAFMTENGSNSLTNISAFHETLKDLDLSLDVTKTRLYDKLRGLKNKYLNNVRREPTYFTKPHEEKIYKISEKIWGGEVGVVEESGSKKSKRNKKSVEKKDICKMEEADDVKKDAGSSFPRLSAYLESQASTYLPMTAVDPKEFAKNMVLKFEKKKAKELEEEWKEYSLMESHLYAKRLKIMRMQDDVLLDVLKRSNLN